MMEMLSVSISQDCMLVHAKVDSKEVELSVAVNQSLFCFATLLKHQNLYLYCMEILGLYECFC